MSKILWINYNYTWTNVDVKYVTSVALVVILTSFQNLYILIYLLIYTGYIFDELLIKMGDDHYDSDTDEYYDEQQHVNLHDIMR